MYGAKRFVPFLDAPEPLYKNFRAAMTAAPVLALLAYVTGEMKGDAALSSISDPYQLQIKGGEPRNRILLRNFDKGLFSA